MVDTKDRPVEERRGPEEILEFFEKGKVFTRELLKENERLRMLALRAEKNKAVAEFNVDPSRITMLTEENLMLRKRLESLELKYHEMERENKDFVDRYIEIQSQNENLLNLYVASYQLHSTLDPDEVIRVIEEIMLNLIGVEHFFVCMIDPVKGKPTVVVGEGPDGPIRNAQLNATDSILAKVLGEGASHFAENSEMNPTYLACTPLKVKDTVVGAIAIVKLLDHKKDGLTPLDYELLNLLADHAATALFSSNLYGRVRRKLETVENFLDALKIRPPSFARETEEAQRS